MSCSSLDNFGPAAAAGRDEDEGRCAVEGLGAAVEGLGAAEDGLDNFGPAAAAGRDEGGREPSARGLGCVAMRGFSDTCRAP